MALIFRADVARKSNNLAETARSCRSGPRQSSPLDCCFSVDMVLSSGFGEYCKTLQQCAFGMESEPHGAAHCEI
jgi:hypothetical protein